LPLQGTDHVAFLPAAGLPWFVAPFGRDSLIVSLVVEHCDAQSKVAELRNIG